MENKDQNEKILLVVILLCLATLGIYKLFFNKTNLKEKIDTKTILEVKEKDDFYTVSSAISNYLKYLTLKDDDAIYELLDTNYKKENSITKDNMYSYIQHVPEYVIYVPKKMFVQRVSENVYKYYTYGYIREDLLDSIGEKSDFYLIILLDQSNLTYSVIPYDGSMFK